MTLNNDQPPPRGTVVRRGGQMVPSGKPGDRVFRPNRRPQAQQVALKVFQKRQTPQPAVVFVLGFLALILVGTGILMLPVASAEGNWTSPLDALFTSTSAVAVTGLVVVDTGTYWSAFGHAVILLLIQLGGLGFMTSSTLLLLVLRREATLRERILLKEALGSKGIGSTLSLAQRIIVFTVLAEVIGAVFLTFGFWSHVPGPEAVWWGVFHSVSAFNNAGFDLVGNYRSLTPFSNVPIVLVTIASLFVLGGISYTVVEDIYQRRAFRRLSLDTKLVVVLITILGILGAFGLLLTEWGNGRTLGDLGVFQRSLNAWFMSLAKTSGFNTVDTAALTDNGLSLLVALMFIGGAAGSTAGGIKVQTFGILLFAIISTGRGLRDVEAFGRRVPPAIVFRALSVALLSVAGVFLLTMLLNVTESLGFLPLLFEAVSAFATVGLSTGITPDISPVGRVLLIFAMFAGRLGPLTLVLALAARERPTMYRLPEEGIKIG